MLAALLCVRLSIDAPTVTVLRVSQIARHGAERKVKPHRAPIVDNYFTLKPLRGS